MNYLDKSGFEENDLVCSFFTKNNNLRFNTNINIIKYTIYFYQRTARQRTGSALVGRRGVAVWRRAVTGRVADRRTSALSLLYRHTSRLSAGRVAAAAAMTQWGAGGARGWQLARLASLGGGPPPLGSAR